MVNRPKRVLERESMPKKVYEPPTLHRLTLEEAEAELIAKAVPGDAGADYLLRLILEMKRKSAIQTGWEAHV